MRFRIRSKLAAALVVPLVALVVGSGLLAVDASAEADRVDSEIELSLIALGPGSLTSALQDERNFVALDLLGLGGSTAVAVASFDEAVTATDAAGAQLRAQVGRFDPEVQDAFGPALEALAGLEEVRTRYEAFDGERNFSNLDLADQMFGAYRSVIDRFFNATATVAADLDHSALRNGVEISDALNRRGEALTVAIRHLAMDMLSGERSPQAAVDISASVARAHLMQERIEELATGPYGVILENDPAQAGFDGALAKLESYVAGEDVDLVELLDTEGLGESTQGDVVTSVLLDEAHAISGDAQDQMRLYVIAAAAIVSLAILVTYFATTSITRPLRALRGEADALARTVLPGAVRSILETPPGDDVAVPEMDAIEVATRDEVGDVAEALNEVQSSTLTLAVDQAMLRRNFTDSFVNLGRRNQLLLDRQLDFITQLEQNETDPEQLDALFRLDHLATRMRRNAESLLVLAGAESPRQWGAPVSITDVVRSGLSEVEDYQRVHIRHLDDARVAGQAVAGLAHVLAELAENALAFSPPDEQVEVKGRWTGNDDYVIAIADNGIGMTDDELERANRRLSGRESYTVAPSRYLGHYVAGNLARQLGVTVRLQDDPAGGLVATVTLPADLLTAVSADDEPLVLPDAAPATDPAAQDPSGWTDSDWTEDGWADDDWPAEDPVAEDPAPDEAVPDPTPEPTPVLDAMVQPGPGPEESAEPDLEDILYGRLYGRHERHERVDDPLPLDEVHDPEPAPLIEEPVEEEPLVDERVDEPVDAPPVAGHVEGGEPADELPVRSAAPLTSDGLPRRVPGAQRPDLSPLAGRRDGDGQVATADDEGAAGGAFGFLQAFQSAGQSAGQPAGSGAPDPVSENGHGTQHESPEEER